MKHPLISRPVFLRQIMAVMLGVWGVGAALIPAGRAADVRSYGVAKGEGFSQTGTAAPSAQGYDFNVFADADTTCGGFITNATVRLTDGTVSNLSTGGDSWGLDAQFADRPSMDAAFPNGTYKLNILSFHDGAKSNLSLVVTGDSYPATVPRVSNYPAAQVVDAASAFTVTWDAWSGGTTADFIQLQLSDNNGDTIYSTPIFGLAGALNGTNTSATIPINTLSPGQMYQGTLLFGRGVINTTDYPGVPGIGAYFFQTSFDFQTTGTPDTDPPFLAGSTPFDGETGVPLNGTIAFTFSEPMRPDYSIEWSGNVDPCNFTYTWQPDHLTLLCTYKSSLPANALISVTLAPNGGNGGFFDLAGNFLDQSPISGSFTTGTNILAHDVVFYVVHKDQKYNQADTGAPVLAGGTPWRFGVDVNTGAPFLVTNAAVQPPAGGPQLLTIGQDTDVNLQQKYASQAALDAAYPSGTYPLTMDTLHEGPRTGTNVLTGDAYPPNAPHVANYAAAQSINPAQNFTLSWDAFSGGGVTDLVALEIDDDMGNPVFQTPEVPGAAGALNGTNLSMVIPAGTLTAGQGYQGSILFAKVTALYSNDYPGVLGASAYTKQTAFNVAAVTPPTPPTFSHVSLAGLNHIQFLLNGTAGQNYTIQVSTNLSVSNWFTLYITNAPGTSFVVPDITATNRQRYYRAVVGP